MLLLNIIGSKHSISSLHSKLSISSLSNEELFDEAAYSTLFLGLSIPLNKARPRSIRGDAMVRTGDLLPLLVSFKVMSLFFGDETLSY